MKLENRMQVLILRHPQELDKQLGTAGLLSSSLVRCTVKTGLSWANLKKASGDPNAENSRWGVLFLGTVKSSAKDVIESNKSPVVVLKKSMHLFLPREYSELDGIVVLDGSWAQAKTMWWRNSWLLKLNRIILKPARPSLYGKLRREPRKECLSTLEAVAECIEHIEKNPELADTLRNNFKAFLDAYKVKPCAEDMSSEKTSSSSSTKSTIPSTSDTTSAQTGSPASI